MKAIFCLDAGAWELIYGDEVSDALSELVNLDRSVYTPAALLEGQGKFEDVDLLVSGWGGPALDGQRLDNLPSLKGVLYGAGSVRPIVSDAFWERGMWISSAYALNAVPVCEYTMGMILLALKNTWQHVRAVQEQRSFVRLPLAGGYHSIVGLVSLGMIGRMVVERLKTFDVQVIAYDPFVSAYAGVEMVSLQEVFERADVVSVHTPWLKETEGLISQDLVARLKLHATLINTSRGAVLDEPGLCAVLAARPDLTAVLDVTWPEPPPPESPLYTLPNVVLTPHIAGSLGAECRRMGWGMVEELKRFLAGQPLQYAISREMAARLA